ncbi:unnamed protein product [Allacma fusca]|uniref:Uncharacterized protein n=1 Tax=Allacma fusca TaxID=39272 RepID=A0A8J2KX99_9HEXA|nr:unnamed protein product [Allacma fusca]
MLVPHIDTTYTLRSPVLPSRAGAMAAARSANNSDERTGERRKIGIRVYNPEPKKKMEREDSVGKEQSRVIQYQKPRTNLEIHVFSPKEMKRLEEDYRNRLIDEILSVMKSLQTEPIRLPSSSSSSRLNHPHAVEIQRRVMTHLNSYKRPQLFSNQR